MGKNRGFTLVELSIVLVIIGLLIGGVLIAQSMISATKAVTQVKQFNQFDIAVSNFQTKFLTLPGDNNFIPGAVGNKNGVIEGSQDTPSHSSFDTEVASFWKQLTESGLAKEVAGTYSDNAASGVRVGVHVPKASVGSKFTAVGIRPGDDINKIGQNFYEIAEYNSTTTDASSYGNLSDTYDTGLTPSDALAIDKKLDDSAGDTGNVIAAGMYNDCVAGGIYQVSNKNGVCKLAIRILPYQN